jgi:hypothetical protein
MYAMVDSKNMWICVDDEFFYFVSCDSKCTFGCF